MPIEIRPAEAAFAGLTKVSRYPSPDRDGARYLPYPDVQHSPKFTISRSDKILTIGSCFARNIERALKQLDLNVLSSYVPGMVGDDNISNKYTSRSILSDLKMALSDHVPTDEELCRTIYVNDKGMARNLAFGGAGSVKGDVFAEVLNSSRKFYENLAKLRDADVVILTFGLIETWYDTTNEIYLNIPPSMGEIKKEPGRFALHVLFASVPEIGIGPLQLSLPDPGTLKPLPLLIAAFAAWGLLARHWPLLVVLTLSALASAAAAVL